jgi:hypothetical protein
MGPERRLPLPYRVKQAAKRQAKQLALFCPPIRGFPQKAPGAAFPSEEKNFPSEEKSFPTEKKSFPTEGKSFPS